MERRDFLGRLAVAASLASGARGWPLPCGVEQDGHAAARAEPALFDGLACVCSCRETSRHRSLLACFETKHPTSCPGCLDEAILVGRLAREGRGLADVRRTVDRAFGR